LVDISLAKEIAENEADIASLKAELNNHKDSITVTNQNRNEVSLLKLVDISIAREIADYAKYAYYAVYVKKQQFK